MTDDVRITGTVTRWGSRDFGFIVSDGWEDEVFVHRADIAGRPETLEPGTRVSFVEKFNPTTKQRKAKQVEILQSDPSRGGTERVDRADEIV
jgi:cold shock CspA family protein